MVDWRDRLLVQDSEDEDEVDTASTVSTTTLNHDELLPEHRAYSPLSPEFSLVPKYPASGNPTNLVTSSGPTGQCPTQQTEVLFETARGESATGVTKTTGEERDIYDIPSSDTEHPDQESRNWRSDEKQAQAHCLIWSRAKGEHHEVTCRNTRRLQDNTDYALPSHAISSPKRSGALNGRSCADGPTGPLNGPRNKVCTPGKTGETTSMLPPLLGFPASKPPDAQVITSSENPCGTRDVSPSKSSPLSSAQSSPQILPSATQRHDDSSIETPLIKDISVNGYTDRGAPTTRYLRKRQPIQMHPFEMEYRNYVRDCMSAGIRPTKVAGVTARINIGKDTISDGPPSPEDSVLLCTPPLGSSQDNDEIIHRRTAFAQLAEDVTISQDDPDTLPALKTLLEETHDPHPSSLKRRKIQHHRRLLGISQDALTHRQERQRFKKFEMPRGLTAAQLPTPDRSSEVVSHTFNTIAGDVRPNPDDWSDNETSPARRNRTPAIAGSIDIQMIPATLSDHGHRTSSDDSKQVRSARKRFRGVLPASYIRLDRQAGAKTANFKKSVGLAPLYKGQAIRRVPRSQTLPSTNSSDSEASLRPVGEDVITLSSDDSEKEEQAHENMVSPSNQSRSAELAFVRNDDHDEVMEDNRIDLMVPKKTRTASTRRRRLAHRQARLPDYFGDALYRKSTSGRMGKVKARPATTRRSEHEHYRLLSQTEEYTTRRRDRLPRRSIVDGLQPPSRVPDFLRVAVRQARRQADQGRYLTASRTCTMSMRDDGIQVNKAFQDWKAGRIPTTSNSTLPRAAIARSPLAVFPLNLLSGQAISSNGSSSALDFRGSGAKPQGEDCGSAKLRQHSLRPLLHQRIENHASPGRQRPLRRLMAQPRLTHHIRRPGQLQALELVRKPQQGTNPPVVCLPGMDVAGQDACDDGRKVVPGWVLDRYLAGVESVAFPGATMEQPAMSQTNHGISQKLIERKRRAKRFKLHSVQTDDYPSPLDSVEISSVPPAQTGSLNFSGGQHRLHFEFSDCPFPKPLPAGSLFPNDTFIGSLEFFQCLNLSHCDLDVPRTTLPISLPFAPFAWGPWTHEVGAALLSIGRALSLLPTDIEQVSNDVVFSLSPQNDDLRKILHYYAKVLFFLDPVDRRDCVRVSSQVVREMLDHLVAARQTVRSNDHKVALLQALAYLAMFGDETRQICVMSTDTDIYSEVLKLEKTILEQLFRTICECDLIYVGTCLSETQGEMHTDTGIFELSVVAEAVVVGQHLCSAMHDPNFGFWTTINVVLLDRIANANSIQMLESVWHVIFHLMPLLDINSHGIYHKGYGQVLSENWTLVKPLVGRALELHSEAGDSQSTNIDAYIRNVIKRCHCLIVDHGWQRSESVLGVFFDFFARRGFSFLPREIAHGSPAFLENLSAQSDVTIMSSDKSFYLFLKLLYTGLKKMQDIYTGKKISNIAWRFIPNHGRSGKKEDDLKQDDLDTLRNQHDLLCVLYAACPAANRLHVKLIRDLVSFDSSHAELCRLNVRSWANLARYQLMLDEPSSIDALVEWLNHMLRSLIEQHRLARTEAETLASRLGTALPREVLELNITSNQKQIESLLGTLLVLTGNLCDSTNGSKMAQLFFSSAMISVVFTLFDPKIMRMNRTIDEALQVYRSYIALLNRHRCNTQPTQDNEDSQDYGDWPSDDELGAVIPASLDSKYDHIANALVPLLSNVFGAERFFDEKLLLSLTDTWLAAAHLSVREKRHVWSFYLDEHSTSSWSRLCATDQTRLFRPYYFARIIEIDNDVFIKHTTMFLSEWLNSLAERESMLKYHHLLTANLLNTKPSHALLTNLPFAKDAQGRYTIELSDIRNRRLSLISCILANMRASYEAAMDDLNTGTKVQELRQEYTGLLTRLMMTMKQNYEELHAGSSLRGNYVAFVQQVVEFLQQYTTEICPIDKFFIDSAAFPLPDNDPAYVVGRLRGYGLRSSDASTQKKLAVFMQTVSERAAIDGQQAYLVEQLVRALENDLEGILREAAPLRTLLLEAVFPAYLEVTFHETGAVFTRPILHALAIVFEQNIFSVPLADDKYLAECLRSMTSTLRCLLHAKDLLRIQPAWSTSASLLSNMAWYFKVVHSMLPMLDYGSRRLVLESDETALQAVRGIYEWARGTLLELGETPRGMPLSVPEYVMHGKALSSTSTPAYIQSTRSFCANELRALLRNSWKTQGCQPYRIQGTMLREVAITYCTLAEERGVAIETIRMFQQTYERMPVFYTACDYEQEIDGGTRIVCDDAQNDCIVHV